MSDVPRLLDLMVRLRDRESGCPWDAAQRFESVAPYTLEEAYEVADAIERGDRRALRSELGDLLFQVVFHARMAEEEGAFDFADVVEGICAKLVRRHPHVFAAAEGRRAEAPSWEGLKAAEREALAADAGRRASALDDLPLALPALSRAAKLQGRMARSGFDWATSSEIFAKLEEELGELRAELDAGDREAAARELGDVLFVAASLARRHGIDPETSLRRASARVEGRFRHLEARLAAAGRTPADAEGAELGDLWREAKVHEAAGDGKPRQP